MLPDFDVKVDVFEGLLLIRSWRFDRRVLLEQELLGVEDKRTCHDILHELVVISLQNTVLVSTKDNANIYTRIASQC